MLITQLFARQPAGPPPTMHMAAHPAGSSASPCHTEPSLHSSFTGAAGSHPEKEPTTATCSPKRVCGARERSVGGSGEQEGGKAGGQGDERAGAAAGGSGGRTSLHLCRSEAATRSRRGRRGTQWGSDGDSPAGGWRSAR